MTAVEEWDLTSRISPYLDRHLVFPLLEFIETTLLPAGSVNYKASDIGAARLALLRPTHMVDYAMDAYKSVHGENAAVPDEMQKQKADVYQALEELKKICAPLDKLCKNEEQKVRSRWYGGERMDGGVKSYGWTSFQSLSHLSHSRLPLCVCSISRYFVSKSPHRTNSLHRDNSPWRESKTRTLKLRRQWWRPTDNWRDSSLIVAITNSRGTCWPITFSCTPNHR